MQRDALSIGSRLHRITANLGQAAPDQPIVIRHKIVIGQLSASHRSMHTQHTHSAYGHGHDVCNGSDRLLYRAERPTVPDGHPSNADAELMLCVMYPPTLPFSLPIPFTLPPSSVLRSKLTANCNHPAST
jgi:hypothetical protein